MSRGRHPTERDRQLRYLSPPVRELICICGDCIRCHFVGVPELPAHCSAGQPHRRAVRVDASLVIPLELPVADIAEAGREIRDGSTIRPSL
jgi:hypothetical protein